MKSFSSCISLRMILKYSGWMLEISWICLVQSTHMRCRVPFSLRWTEFFELNSTLYFMLFQGELVLPWGSFWHRVETLLLLIGGVKLPWKSLVQSKWILPAYCSHLTWYRNCYKQRLGKSSMRVRMLFRSTRFFEFTFSGLVYHSFYSSL